LPETHESILERLEERTVSGAVNPQGRIDMPTIQMTGDRKTSTASGISIDRMRHALQQMAPVYESLVTRLYANGYEAFITGGAIRDLLLCRKPKDYDIITNAPPDQIATIFRNENVQAVGRTFNITLINGIEVATLHQNHHQTGEQLASRAGLLEALQADLKRRDLTFNSIAFCPNTGQLFDPNNGRIDLENRLVRFVGNPQERIDEDPIRIVRACRFASDLNGVFEASSLRAMQENGWQLQTQAPERLRLEIIKAMKTRQASHFFVNLVRVGILGYLFPSLTTCVGHDGGRHHGEDVFEHCMLVGDALSSRCRLTKLTGYLHDVGKPSSAAYDHNGNVISFINHETIGERLVEKELSALKFSKKEISHITSLIHLHMRTVGVTTTPKALRKLLARLDKHDIDYRTLLRHQLADRQGNLAKQNMGITEIKQILKRFKNETFSGDRRARFNIAMLAVNGNDLIAEFALSPGQIIGKTLKTLFEAVLENGVINEREPLLNMAASLLSQPRQENRF
jgi:tRNA nucleotidyltransferase (CCA-adding enzyme)